MNLAMLLIAFSIPPAAKTVAIIAFVFAIVQILKQSSVLKPYIKGWGAIILNAVFSLLGLLVLIPSDQLYNWSTIGTTFLTWLSIILGAAGVHGTAKSLTAEDEEAIPPVHRPPSTPPPSDSATTTTTTAS